MSGSERNEIRRYERVWNHDDYFWKRYRQLSENEQERYDEDLNLFLNALAETNHPFQSKLVKYFRPGPFRGMRGVPGWTWQEYRLKGQNRVVALVKQVDDYERGNLEFGLIARTLQHDHTEKKFRDYLKQRTADISDFLADRDED